MQGIFTILSQDKFLFILQLCPLSNSNFEGRSVVVTAPENWYGADTVSFYVMDSGGLSDTTEIIISVALVNNPPVISGFPDSVIFRADSSVILNLNEYVTDVGDPDLTLHWSVVQNDSVIVSINDTTNVAVLSSPLSRSGWKTLIFTVMDSSFASDSDTLLIHVTPYVGISVEEGPQIPKVYSLFQNYPDPFNPITTIKYGLPKGSKVTLKIFNILGQEVTISINLPVTTRLTGMLLVIHQESIFIKFKRGSFRR